MASVIEIYRYIDSFAPFSIQMDFDNSGFLVGRQDAQVQKVMVALDITEKVIEEAAAAGCQLIVAHHPVIFFPAKSVTDADAVGRRLLALVEHHMAAICAHTNLDAVSGGVNDALAQALQLENIQLLQTDGTDHQGRPYGIGRVGEVREETSLASFAKTVSNTLHTPNLRIADGGKTVHKVAVGGGSCGDMYPIALAQGCDTMVTADIGYHTFLDAGAMGLNLIDAGHFSTENLICAVLAERLREGFPELEIFCSKFHKEVFSCL